MCDTICALPNWSRLSDTLLAKNSDRDPNEPHVVRYIPAQEHASGKQVRCTYIEVPQVARTHAVLLLKPDWIWGAEMGVNEHGVAIGNEAVFTKAKKGPDSLLGMDLLRLALERSESAGQALKVILQLLDRYGQGGNCGFSKDFCYDNSFLIADTECAFVLETSGRSYAVVEVSQKAAISNGLSIRREHILCGGITAGEDFAGRFADPLYTFFAAAKRRRGQSLSAIERGPVSVPDMVRVLRTHAPRQKGREFRRGNVGSVCMHAGGLIGDHTTGSFVAVLRKSAPITVWVTGASTPCISAFKPVFFGVDSGAPVFGSDAEGRQYWLKRERLHRAALAGHVNLTELRARRDALETAWFEEEARLFSSGVPDTGQLSKFAARAAAEEEALINEFSCPDWMVVPGRGHFGRYWRKKNASLGVPAALTNECATDYIENH